MEHHDFNFEYLNLFLSRLKFQIIKTKKESKDMKGTWKF